MMHIYARKGDQIIDHSGKVFATLARDLSVHEMALPRASAFQFAGPAPELGTPMPRVLFEWLQQRRAAALAAMPNDEPTFRAQQVV